MLTQIELGHSSIGFNNAARRLSADWVRQAAGRLLSPSDRLGTFRRGKAVVPVRAGAQHLLRSANLGGAADANSLARSKHTHTHTHTINIWLPPTLRPR
jgi:hypothetical protein